MMNLSHNSNSTIRLLIIFLALILFVSTKKSGYKQNYNKNYANLIDEDDIDDSEPMCDDQELYDNDEKVFSIADINRMTYKKLNGGGTGVQENVELASDNDRNTRYRRETSINKKNIGKRNLVNHSRRNFGNPNKRAKSQYQKQQMKAHPNFQENPDDSTENSDDIHKNPDENHDDIHKNPEENHDDIHKNPDHDTENSGENQPQEPNDVNEPKHNPGTNPGKEVINDLAKKLQEVVDILYKISESV
ncbi:hypothetical protein BB558_000382 [Smittium angustum]|uniref:Uncharacterized protein n=1 Tax=Smittium angustum TaxID=133377 RepID=A0A2U1JEK7_SMIAN|nr:hypothetical protein BB558_000382 [Smittium angustum]